MNKSQLIDTLAARYEGNRKQAAHALESVLDTITREVAKGEKVAITGFGSFEKRVREARWVRNPRTGERIKAKKTAIPKFSAGADLKAVVSGAKKLPKLTLAAAGGRREDRGRRGEEGDRQGPRPRRPRPRRPPRRRRRPRSRRPPRRRRRRRRPAKKTTAKKTRRGATAKKAPAKKTTTARRPPPRRRPRRRPREEDDGRQDRRRQEVHRQEGTAKKSAAKKSS